MAKSISSLAPRRAFRTKRELAIERLREAILRGKYRPGERLRQNQLAQELGLSPTPVREALAELQAQGVLVHESHKGTRVVELNLSALEELYPLRGLLEGYAAELAVPRLTAESLEKLASLQVQMEDALRKKKLGALRDADNEFHMTIYSATRNGRLLSLIRQLWAAFPRYMLWVVPGRAEDSILEHSRILAAAQRRDPDATAREVRTHLESALRALRGYIQSGGAPVGE